jgi:hypothetical protein
MWHESADGHILALVIIRWLGASEGPGLAEHGVISAPRWRALQAVQNAIPSVRPFLGSDDSGGYQNLYMG